MVKPTKKQQRDPELIANANSEGLILDYYQITSIPQTKGVLGRAPRTEPKKALDLLRNDPVVRSSVIKLVDKAAESGWRVQAIDDNKKARIESLERNLKKLRFNRLLRKVMFHLIMYNNAFVEIVKRGDEVTDINLLEPEFMRIDADAHGNILGYYQQVPNPNGSNGSELGNGTFSSYPYWEPERVVHFKLDDFTTNVWGEFNIEAVYETVLIKDYARQILLWFTQTNQMRPVIAVSDTTASKMKDFLAFLKASESNISKPIPVEGTLNLFPLQDPSKIIPFLLNIIEWCNGEIRQLLQVPEIAAGINDTSGRSQGAEAREYINTRIFNIHSLIEDDVTYDLFPKMGWQKAEFVFGILDETVRTRVFETAQLMRQTQFSNDAILEYLEDQGVVFETDKPLLDPMELAQMSNKQLGTGNEGVKGNVSADAAPSRSRQNSQDLSKGSRKAATPK